MLALRRHHRLPAARLLAELGVSRPTLMRAVKAAGAAVLTSGRARRTCYAARRPLRGSSAPLPVFRVDVHAGAELAGQLHLAHPDGCVFEFSQALEWPLDADMRDGWFDGIPYPLQDLRPEGFLGRAFARENAALLQVSDDPRAWSDDDTLHALSLLGADLSGNYIVGETAYRLWLAQIQRPVQAVTDAQLAQAYPDRAQLAMQRGVQGSSAGGEFPKFTAVRELGGAPTQVIVKFSGSDSSPGTERWADLLVCEQLALQSVAGLPGLSAAVASIHRAGGRTFLEVVRFDRRGAHGRSALCSWAAINNAWFDLGGRSWAEGANRLLERALIDTGTRDAVTCLWHFGQLIANTDMHDGNLSFVPGGAGLRLAPVYDMLPMGYAPQRGVELADVNFTPRLPLPAERVLWQQAAEAAEAFWNCASQDRRISGPFRQTCAINAQAVHDASQRSVSLPSR
ncbi:MAG: type II toxin-antitoxin system HipA family toxin YjjJ [Vitreoscilla sp.]|nr:type II toxin-antitoxin system HipA family toxin YjjJ [Vitreoscilla sp.]